MAASPRLRKGLLHAGLTGVGVGVLVLLLKSGGGPDDPTKRPGWVGKGDERLPEKTGTIRGKVVCRGAVPAGRMIGGIQSCPAHPAEDLLAKADRLQGAVVYLQSGFEGFRFATPETAARLDQRGCRFVPHVLALRVAQTLLVQNSDGVTHNTRAVAGREILFDMSFGNSERKTISVGAPRAGVRIGCNLHDWMSCWIHVFEHPYFQVTGEDGGYVLRDVPADRKLQIAIWHEAVDRTDPPVALKLEGAPVRAVEVRAGETRELDFDFEIAPGEP